METLSRGPSAAPDFPSRSRSLSFRSTGRNNRQSSLHASTPAPVPIPGPSSALFQPNLLSLPSSSSSIHHNNRSASSSVTTDHPAASEVIDLTGPSPPRHIIPMPSGRPLDDDRDETDRRSSKRIRLSRSSQPSTTRANNSLSTTGATTETVIINSDSDSGDDGYEYFIPGRSNGTSTLQSITIDEDDEDEDEDSDGDVIIVNPTAGPSRSAASSSSSAASSTGATVGSNMTGRNGRRAGRAVILPSGGFRGAAPHPPPVAAPPAPTPSSSSASGRLRELGMGLFGRITGSGSGSRTGPVAANSRASSAGSTASSNAAATAASAAAASALAAQARALAEQHAFEAAFETDMDDEWEFGGLGGAEIYYHHLARSGLLGGSLFNSLGYADSYHSAHSNIPHGLQGLVRKPATPSGKKYGVRMSHPNKIPEGFSRNIVNPPEEGEEEPAPVAAPSRKKKGKRAAVSPAKPKEDEVPACASCLEPLLLNQVGERRIWVLRCGHVVCGKCIGDAKMRCEEIKEAERKSRWTMDVDGKGKGKGKASDVITFDDKEEAEIGGSGKGKKLGKGKEKSRASETGIEENWTTCPVVGCEGAQSDLLAGDDDYSRPFEAFV